MSKMIDKRESGRIKDAEQKRILDEAARRRRQRKALEALEQDNFQEDPHADLKMSKKAPKFEESMETQSSQQGSRKKKKYRSDLLKYRFKKSFAALIEEEHMTNKDPPNYVSACAPPSKLPARHFCAVCGYPSTYTCVQCGARYCCIRCLGTHQDTRCLKWTA
ncbi:zinc finger HIT domain-containing protein 1-like [Ruditapes philippinarum]|uniref:zinc finger HIT domain-containing protein 1-like n=1 Tax=Ruditapes philippinarum TaxID=129788 RepID=UPI00295ACCF9|nr:zinc finger HIT domain-containing protein 1-like [Ruditapes philippinarum]